MGMEPLRSLKIYPWAIAFGIFCLFLDILSVTSSSTQCLLLQGLKSGVSFDPALLDLSDLVQNILYFSSIAAFVVFLILFLIWKVGMYKNTRIFGHRPESSHAMAAASYFIPFINLYRPLAIMFEIIGAVCAGKKKVTLYLLASFWWFANIVSIIINFILTRSTPSDASSIEAFISFAQLNLVSEIASLLFQAPFLVFVIVLTREYKTEHHKRMIALEPALEEVE